MKRFVLGVLAVVSLTGTALAAEKPAVPPPAKVTAPAKTTAEVVLDEAGFLSAANDAAKDGDSDGAVELYQSAIIYSPSDPAPYQKLAQLFAANRQATLAQQYYDLALDVEPAYPPALAGLAILDLAAGDRAGAETAHQMLLHACGKMCPETAQVEKAMSGAVDVGSNAK